MVDRVRVHSLNCRAPSSNSAGDAEPLPVSGDFGSEASVGRRETTQKSLLQMLEEIANKVRSLEREGIEAAATIRALERQVDDLTAHHRLRSFINGHRERPQVSMGLHPPPHQKVL